MQELYVVDVRSAVIPVAGERQVVFHGINKSGSLAMANVINEAYFAAHRANDVYSAYHAVPRETERVIEILHRSTGHSFFVAHYLYGATELPGTALWVTQVRHPVQRTLSVHGWLRRNYLRKHGDLEGFPDLASWILTSKGRRFTQMSQLAIGFGEDYKPRVARTKPAELRRVALDRLENDIAWFGIAEVFEESIFALAHLCGLPAVPPWQKDTRNQWREPLSETEPATIALIQETFAEEIAFYDEALALFRSRIATTDFGSSFAAYKERCSSEYGERFSP
jgi:hypothetical protein